MKERYDAKTACRFAFLGRALAELGQDETEIEQRIGVVRVRVECRAVVLYSLVQQADLSTITAKVFEKDADGVFVEITPAPTVTVATAILDTVDTTNEIWTVDTIGHNFIHDLGAVYFPNGGKIVKAEYKFTYVGGDVGWGVWEGPVRGVSSS